MSDLLGKIWSEMALPASPGINNKLIMNGNRDQHSRHKIVNDYLAGYKNRNLAANKMQTAHTEIAEVKTFKLTQENQVLAPGPNLTRNQMD